MEGIYATRAQRSRDREDSGLPDDYYAARAQRSALRPENGSRAPVSNPGVEDNERRS